MSFMDYKKLTFVKSNYFLTALFTIFLIIGFFSVGVKNVQAQQSIGLFFDQANITASPSALLKLKAYVGSSFAGSNLVNFIGTSFQIDITKVKVKNVITYPLVVNKSLFLAVPATDSAYINCSPATGDNRCTNGVIRFAISHCPTATTTTSTPGLEGCLGVTNPIQVQNNIIKDDIATITLESINNAGGTATVNTIFSTAGNQFVKGVITTTTPAPTPMDLTPFTANPAVITVPMRGDGTFDGMVNALDLTRWKAYFNKTTNSGASMGDYNGDGIINALDLTIWKANFNR